MLNDGLFRIATGARNAEQPLTSLTIILYSPGIRLLNTLDD